MDDILLNYIIHESFKEAHIVTINHQTVSLISAFQKALLFFDYETQYILKVIR